MLLDKYRDYFKEKYKWQYSISIGKIDNNKEKMITFYNSKRVMKNEGFINDKKTKIKPITILLKYGSFSSVERNSDLVDLKQEDTINPTAAIVVKINTFLRFILFIVWFHY